MELTVNLTAADWSAYYRFLAERAYARSKPEWKASLLGTMVFISLPLLHIRFIGRIHWTSFFLAVVLCLAAFVEYKFNAKRRAASLAPTDGGMLVGRWKFTIAPEALKIEGENFCSIIAWSGVRDVVDTAELIVVALDSTSAYLLPKRELSDAKGVLDYVKRIRAVA